MVPILCLPSVVGAELTAAEMNWTCVVYGGPMIMVTIWWFVSAHKWFKGPKVNIEHMMLERAQVVEGQDTKDPDDSSAEVLGSDKIKV